MLGWNKLHLDIFLLNMISDEVMSDINVLCPCVLIRILGEADGAYVVAEDGSLKELQAKISQLVLQPQHLRTTACGSNVFCLCG